MTSKERVIAALNRKEPDRVPTFEWIINPDVIEKITNQNYDWTDWAETNRSSMDFSSALIEFIRQMDIDGIAIGTNMNKEKVDDGYFRDEWGITRRAHDEYPTPVGCSIKSKEDLKSLKVPDPDADYRFDDIKNAMREFGDEKAIIIRLRDVFSQPRDLMGFSEVLESFYTQPELVSELMEISVEYNTQLAKIAKNLGGEIIVVGDDYANNNGTFMSPKMFREMVLPHFRKLIRNFKDLGMYVIKHTDGNIMSIIDDIIDTGIDCIDPIDPLADMDIEFIKQKYGDRVCIKGNVDCVSTLVDKSPQEVIKETKHCILKASIGGGHIISSSNSIHAGINPVNYKVFLDAVKEYGTYPLDMEKLKI